MLHPPFRIGTKGGRGSNILSTEQGGSIGGGKEERREGSPNSNFPHGLKGGDNLEILPASSGTRSMACL